MKKIQILSALIFGAAVLSGCAVVPAGPPGVIASVAVEDDGAPPAEYIVEGEPVYYESEPGVAFYPMFVDFPGSCFCITPVRFYGGAWYAPGRVMVHNGNWAFHRPGSGHLNAWRGNRGAYGGHAAVRGSMQRGPGGRMHAVPPAGIHAQHGQRQGPVQHAAPQHNAQQPRPAPQVQHQQRQARPAVQQRAPARAPAKAPAKKKTNQ